jgi:hypothetical protein
MEPQNSSRTQHNAPEPFSDPPPSDFISLRYILIIFSHPCTGVASFVLPRGAHYNDSWWFYKLHHSLLWLLYYKFSILVSKMKLLHKSQENCSRRTFKIYSQAIYLVIPNLEKRITICSYVLTCSAAPNGTRILQNKNYLRQVGYHYVILRCTNY